MTSTPALGTAAGGTGAPAVAPPFDPELAPALEIVLSRMPRPVTLDMIPALREREPVLPPVSDEELSQGGAFEITERQVAGPPGAPDISLLIGRPAGATAPTGAIYYIHGGGMISGDNRLGLPLVLEWAAELRTAVISVEYRLAPETPHPGPVEDCYAGLVWTAAQADELGIDAGRIVICGASAGGGLAAAVALLARDRGGPALAGQMLRCPMLDDRNDTPSSWQMAGLDVWDRVSNETGWTALLGETRGGPDVSPYAAPARAADLSALPPAFIEVGSAETFRDEAVGYATRIWQAGGVAELHVWPGGFHGFRTMMPQAAISQGAAATQRDWLRRVFAALSGYPRERNLGPMIPADEEILVLHQRYAPTPEALNAVYTHSRIVADIAGQLLAASGFAADPALVRAGCLLHDVGVYRLYDDAGRLDHAHYIRHGVLGYQLLAEAGFPPVICRFASHHTGVGLTRDDVLAQRLPVPPADYLADTPEEEVVMYADKFHTKTTPPALLTADAYAAVVRRFGSDKESAFKAMRARLGEPDLKSLAAAYRQRVIWTPD
jgi:putative nucleotidyltransferase with HDIG domain